MVLNYIWIAFFLVAFLLALFKMFFMGDTTVFSRIIENTFDTSKAGFELSLGYTGAITLWLGIMNIGEKAGAIRFLSKIMSPFFSRLFPELPAGHPATGNIIMNFSANMLGLDNAATPLGLKAMSSMQELNTQKDTASNAQIMFLVLNTSGLTLIPVAIMAYRAQAGALNPADIFIPILIATFFSTLVGMLAVGIKQGINFFDRILFTCIAGATLLVAGIIAVFSKMTSEQISLYSGVISGCILFSLITSFIAGAVYKKVNVYEAFIEGAKDGFSTAIKIIPYLIAMLVAIGVFRTAGGLDLITNGLKWFFSNFGFDTRFVDALPTAVMKPLSGGGARGVMMDTMRTMGADSFAGRLSCIFQGAADTTFYIVALYFGSVGITKARYSVAYGLLADVAGVIAAIIVAYIFFK